MSDSQGAFGRTIQIFLADGVPNGLIIASIFGWTGSVLVGSQATFGRLLARPEVDRSGVYFLYGPDPSDPLKMRAYIGEADSVRERIAQSAAERSFWETAAVVTTSDDALTKGHVRFLEARLLSIARDAGRVLLDNNQLPQSDRRRLPEADRANMEAFLSNLQVVLPVVGLDLLKSQPRPVPVQTPNHQDESQMSTADRPKFEIRHKSGVTATAEEIDGEFVVLAGSRALKNPGYTSNGYSELKRRLLEQGVLVNGQEPEFYVFAKAYAFKSVSAAAAVVLDRNSNGRTEWKVVGATETYDEWQRDAAGLAMEPA